MLWQTRNGSSENAPAAIGLVAIRIELAQIGLRQKTRFFELHSNQSKRQFRAIDRNIEIGQVIGERANMVFVPVGDKNDRECDRGVSAK